MFPNNDFFLLARLKGKEPPDFWLKLYPIWICQFSFCGQGWIIKSQTLDGVVTVATPRPTPPPGKGWRTACLSRTYKGTAHSPLELRNVT